MASPTEQMFDHMKLSALWRNKGLLNKLLILFAAFFAMRLGSFIPLPGVDTQVWADIWRNSPFANFVGLL